MNDFLANFARRFAALDRDSLGQLAELYAHDIEFRDPLHAISGLPALERYFAELYANAQQIRFDFHGHDTLGDGEGYLRWTLHYRHPRLAAGRSIAVDGCSHLHWRDGKVLRHRDYFDAGALLYEHLPLMGSAIRWLKRRLA